MAAKPPRRLSENELWEYALKSLGARAQAVGQLKDKLRRRAERPADVDSVLARLKEYAFVNDRQFADRYAARRLENQGFGQARVMADLRARKVAGSIAESAVRSAFQGVDETGLIEQFLAKKYRSRSLATELSDQKGLASAYRKLRGAGFSHGNSLKVLKKHASESATEALETMESENSLQEE